MANTTTLRFTLADALRMTRTKPPSGRARISQEAMAIELGVSRPTVSAWEAGTHPPFWAVVRWAEITGADLAWLSGKDVGDGSPVIHDAGGYVQQSLFRFAA